MADLQFEQAALARLGAGAIIAGVDEVGRGPWAGPVVAAAVILDPTNIPNGLTDSKKLSAKKRDALSSEIHACAKVAIAQCSVEEIDQMNILAASLLAMTRAIKMLGHVDHALIDGNKLPQDLTCTGETIVKGDSKSASIAAASIVAKTYRDNLMLDLSKEFPGYGWESNAGYGTKMHQSGLRNLGVTPHHRHSFKPIHNILYPANLRK